MMITIKGKVKSRNRQFTRRSKREVLFCEMTEIKHGEHGTTDTYSYDFVSLKSCILQFMYLIKHSVQRYINCHKNSVVRFYYVIFKV